MPLTKEQILEVVDWMNSWEQMRGTAIPIRFKEDFMQSQSIKIDCPFCHEMHILTKAVIKSIVNTVSKELLQQCTR